MNNEPNPSVSLAHSGPNHTVKQESWFMTEVRPHEPGLRSYLRRQFPSVDADDVVQESYSKLLQARTADSISSVKAYVFAIARNTARRLIRRQRLYSDTSVNDLPDSCLLDDGRDAADLANAHQQLELVITALDALPTRCREIASLAALHGLTNAEIAQKLGLSVDTVRVQMARAVKKCVDFLKERGERS